MALQVLQAQLALKECKVRQDPRVPRAFRVLQVPLAQLERKAFKEQQACKAQLVPRGCKELLDQQVPQEHREFRVQVVRQEQPAYKV